MPSTAEAHRACIGLFYPVLMQIFIRKRLPSKSSRRRSLKCSTKKELTTWIACVTLSMLYCLFVLLLTKCMDVEKNPGPGMEYGYSMVQNLQADMERRFSQIMDGLQMHSANISQKMEENFGRLDHTLGQLTEDVVRLKTALHQDREDIQDLQEENANLKHRLDSLEQELNSLEMISRRCNLKFLGVTEMVPENYKTTVQRIIDILNECASSRTWTESDIERAHRIGDRRHRSDQPRPLIVRFHRWSDKMEILNDTIFRDLLRREGIRVSSDLTTRQREEVQHYRRQGKIAYYKSGRLQVEERRTNSSTDNNREHGGRFNADHGGRERTGQYHPRQAAPSTDRRHNAHYVERRPTDNRSSSLNWKRGDALHSSRAKERDWNPDSHAWSSTTRHGDSGETHDRYQHGQYEDNARYDWMECNSEPHFDHFRDYSHASYLGRVHDNTGNVDAECREKRRDEWEQTYVKEPNDGTDINPTHANRGTDQ